MCTCGVVCVSLLAGLFLFFSSLFSFLLYVLFHLLFLSLFHCTHRDEIRQTSDSTN